MTTNESFQARQGAGRPPGAKNKRTRLYIEAVAPHLADILAKIVSQALGGCKDSQSLIFRKYAPRHISDALVEQGGNSKKSSTEIAAQLIEQMLSGNLPPDDAGKALQALSYYEAVIQASDDRKKLDRILEGRKK
tara:strand:+ start:2871 stop:3275 length:405 start_codon:yes stop_codon:yes gene_type:complete